MTLKVIPTIFASNKKEFDKRFEKLINISNALQIDFMDGKFVKNKSVSISDVPDLKRYKIEFEAHLMAKDPAKYVVELKEKGFSKIIFHIETVKSDTAVEELIGFIKMEGLKAMIAINPKTKVKKIIPFLDKIDGILFMGVNPGKEHQKFINSVYKKIEELRKLDNSIFIQVDGGIDFKVAEKLSKIEVNCINTGSFATEADNPEEIINGLSNF